jgi:hypothetical protein
MSQVQLEAFFLVQNACTAFPSTLVSMLELSPPLPVLLLLRVAGLSGLNTIIVPPALGFKPLRIAHVAYLSVLDNSWNKQRLISKEAISGWSHVVGPVFVLRGRI